MLRMERFSVIVVVVAVVASEVEEVEEIADRRTIERHIGILFVNDGVWEIIPAAMR